MVIIISSAEFEIQEITPTKWRGIIGYNGDLPHIASIISSQNNSDTVDYMTGGTFETEVEVPRGTGTEKDWVKPFAIITSPTFKINRGNPPTGNQWLYADAQFFPTWESTNSPNHIPSWRGDYYDNFGSDGIALMPCGNDGSARSNNNIGYSWENGQNKFIFQRHLNIDKFGFLRFQFNGDALNLGSVQVVVVKN